MPRVLALLFVLHFVSRLVLVGRPLEALDGVTIPDDAYLSLTVARNIAAGHGPLYGDAPTNGFQPLYVFLMVPVYWAIPGDPYAPVRIALAGLALFESLTLYLLLRALARVCRSPWTVALAGLAWIFSPYAVSNSLNGLETAIACFFLVASLCWLQRCSPRAGTGLGAAQALGLGALLGAGVVARIDHAIFACCLVGVYALGQLWQRRAPAELVRELAYVGAAAAFVYWPWAAYSYAYTGDLYPVSGRAVRFMSLAHVDHQPTFENWYGPMLRNGSYVALARNFAYLGTALIAAGVLLLGLRRLPPRALRAEQWRLLLPPLAFSVALVLAYTLYIFAPWFFERYLYPTSIAAFLVMSLCVDALLAALREVRPRREVWVAGLLGLLVCGLQLADGRLRKIVAPAPAGDARGYMAVGLWAKQNFPDGTVIGSSQTGGLGYFADNLKVVNLDGVVNARCLESLEAGENLAYIRAQGIEYVVGWEDNLRFIAQHSRDFREEDLPIVRRLEFQSWGEDWYVARVAGAGTEKGG